MTSEAIDSTNELWNTFDSFPKTLIHNDCNLQNICIRKATSNQDSEDPQRMCLYDWKLAMIDVPHSRTWLNF